MSFIANNISTGLHRLSVKACLWLVALGPTCLQAAEATQLEKKCVVIEAYVSDAPSSEHALAAATHVAKLRTGVRLVVRSIDSSPKAQERLCKIAKYFRFDEKSTPVIYTCNRVIRSGRDASDFQQQIESALDMVVYVRSGCQRCANAKAYLPSIAKRYPGMRIVYRDILSDPHAARSLNELVRQHRKAASSTPVFHFCDELIIGFDRPESTGARLRQALDHWMADCPTPPKKTGTPISAHGSAPEVAAIAPF